MSNSSFIPTQYRQIAKFAPNMKGLEVENPLSYCLDNSIDIRFNHSGNSDIYGCHSRPCQSFMSNYCAQGWDGFCETASHNTSKSYPNQLQPASSSHSRLSSGEILIRNTAIRKYLLEMRGANLKIEPFDPSVPTSPMISYWVPIGCNDGGGECSLGGCQPIYGLQDTRGIDSDPVMNKLLMNPLIAFDVLTGILKTLRMQKRLHELSGTKLGTFFQILQSRGF
jgi:hypothetical protein